jgi:hypothetical protein
MTFMPTDLLPKEEDVVVGIFRRKVLQKDPMLPPISSHDYEFAVGTQEAVRKISLLGHRDCVRTYPLRFFPPHIGRQVVFKYFGALLDLKHPKELEKYSLDELINYYVQRPLEKAAKDSKSRVVPLKLFSYTVFNHGDKIIAFSRPVSVPGRHQSKYKETDTTLESICANHIASEGVTHFCTETAAKQYLQNHQEHDPVAADLHNLLFKFSKPDPIRDAHLKGHDLDYQHLVPTGKWLEGLGNDFRASRTYKEK